jgi:hypothetical protein
MTSNKIQPFNKANPLITWPKIAAFKDTDLL